MPNIYKKLLTILSLLILAIAGITQTTDDPLSKMAYQIRPNVVAIRATFANGDEENGFGFISGEKGQRLFIATAAHVVRGNSGSRTATQIEVRFYGELEKVRAKYVSHWDAEDLALLEITQKPSWLSWRADCADFGNPAISEDVRFVGRYESARGPAWVFPGKGEVYDRQGHIIYFSINTILPGTSGAPLLNKNGIIGLITDDDQAGSQALSISRVRDLFSGNISGGDKQYPYFTLEPVIIVPPAPKENPLPDVTKEKKADSTINSDSSKVVPNIKPENMVDPNGLVYIKGGSFIMGSELEDVNKNAAYKVNLDSYFIAPKEVTNEEYCRFLNERGNQKEGDTDWINLSGSWEGEKCRIRQNGGKFKVEQGYEKYPVIFVTWYGAKAYCDWLSTATGLEYRLPTEAEWEYAAGNGSKHTQYSWGNDPPFNKKGGNVPDETLKKGVDNEWQFFDGYTDNYIYTAPISSFAPNELGLYDMSGNVREWCSDWLGNYPLSATNNPKGPIIGSNRVHRGGSWNSRPIDCKTIYRNGAPPNKSFIDLGFRLARTP